MGTSRGAGSVSITKEVPARGTHYKNGPFYKFLKYGPFLKSLLNLLHLFLFFFYVLVFGPQGVWDPSSPDQRLNLHPCLGR